MCRKKSSLLLCSPSKSTVDCRGQHFPFTSKEWEIFSLQNTADESIWIWEAAEVQCRVRKRKKVKRKTLKHLPAQSGVKLGNTFESRRKKYAINLWREIFFFTLSWQERKEKSLIHQREEWIQHVDYSVISLSSTFRVAAFNRLQIPRRLCVTFFSHQVQDRERKWRLPKR